ncbi:hypothetical protein ACP275_02G151200 [Erythranthe tilingii]
MKKAKSEDGIDRISELPQCILQRILYFLSQQDAVRTSVFSKSWRRIWCTRPNLNFSDALFKHQQFTSFACNTLQRYSDQKLCVDDFRLSISLLDLDSISLLRKWIPLLPTIGVKQFHLSILSEQITDLPSVVFEAGSELKLLHLQNCNLVQNTPEIIPFVRLQVIILCHVSIANGVFDKVISSCRLLTTMWFQECKGLKTITVEKKVHRYLNHFAFINKKTSIPYDECSIQIDSSPDLKTIKIIGSKIRFNGRDFINLSSLALHNVVILSSNNSNSVEQSRLLIRIVAPRIKYLYYSGFFIPSIIYAPASGTSVLGLYIRDVDHAPSWFLGLSKLLKSLRRSDIWLNIVQLTKNNVDIQEDDLVRHVLDDRPVVVHLKLHISHLSSLPSVLNCLFCICRPRKIAPSWFSQGICWDRERKMKELGEFFCNIQKMRESGNQEIWRDLEDLTIEGLDTSLSESAFSEFGVRLQWKSDQDCA